AARRRPPDSRPRGGGRGGGDRDPRARLPARGPPRTGAPDGLLARGPGGLAASRPAGGPAVTWGGPRGGRALPPCFGEGRRGGGQGLARDGVAVGQGDRDPNAMQVFVSQMFTIRWLQGRLEESEPCLKTFADQYLAAPAWRYGLTFLHTELDHMAEARAEFERVAVNDFADLPFDLAWLPAISSLA